MKKVLFSIINILLIFALISCTEGNVVSIKEVSQDVIIYNQLDTTYNYDDVTNYLKQNPDMHSFFSEFGLKQYKSDKSSYYTVIKTDKGLSLIYFYNDWTYNRITTVTFSDSKYEEEFSQLHIGATLDKAMQIDPDGSYDFLYASWSGYPQISFHYFESGNCYMIVYNDRIINNIVHFTI